MVLNPKDIIPNIEAFQSLNEEMMDKVKEEEEEEEEEEIELDSFI